MNDKPASRFAGPARSAASHPSRISPGSIARPRLIEQFKQARSRRCIVVQGPAGSGKTTLLGAWRRELVAAGADVAWVALSEDTRFIDALHTALSSLASPMARDASVLLERSDDPASLEGIMIALIRGVAASRREFVLVLDDAHHLQDAQTVGAVQLLLDHGPPNLSCLFASRTPLALSLVRLRDQGELLELGFEGLRFTLEESRQLVASLLDEADEPQARSLHDLTDGWAAGLKLLCLDLRHRRAGANKPIDEHVRDAQTFARYFEQEVLCRLSAEDLAFAVRCALPEHFNAALCAALQGDVSSPSPAELLVRLESQGIFLVAAGPHYPEGWWRLHPLLRDVLRERLDALPESDLQSLHVRAWRWFAAHGMPQQAVHHALRTGDAESAADLVEHCAEALFAKGELRQLAGLVRQLPETTVNARAALHLWMAWTQLYERRLPECARSIAQLSDDMVGAPAAVRYRFTLLRGFFAFQCDDTAAAMTILPELLDSPANADAMALSGRRNLLTWVYLYRGDYEKARRVQADDIAEPHRQDQALYGTAFGILAGRCLVGLTHAVEGQMIQAERIYRDVLYEAERRGASCVDAGCLAAGLLAEVLYELNDPEGAVRLLEEHLDVLEHVSMPDTVLRVMLVMGRAQWLAGRPLDALAYVEQIHDYAERMGLDRLAAYCLLEQVQLHLRRNAPGQVDELMATLDAVDARHARTEAGVLSEIRVATERAHIALEMYRGELPSAQRRIEALEALCRERGRVRRIPYLRIKAAAIARQSGNVELAGIHVREALQLGQRLGLVRTLLDAHADAPDLIRETLPFIEDDPVLCFYAERLEAAARDRLHATAAVDSRATPAGDAMALASLSPREAEIVQLLLQAMPNKKIARVLDVSLDTVKWHLKNCYGKLGVSGRDEVVERMRALDAG